MTARPPKEVLILAMPPGEALERYIGTDPRELHKIVARSKKGKQPARSKKRKVKKRK